MDKWLPAVWILLPHRKKGYSSHRLAAAIGVCSRKTAWFMLHRIRCGAKKWEFETPLWAK